MKFFFLCLFLSSPAFASLSFGPISGRVFSDVYVPTQDPYPDQPLEQASLSTWLEASPQFTNEFTSHIVYQGDGFDGKYSFISGDSTATHWESRLREGYLNYSIPGWDFRAGEQIIAWGKSDAINPTDFNSAKNYSFYNPDDEVRRLGSLSFSATHTFNEGASPFSLTLIWTPIFAQGKNIFPPNLLPANVSVGAPTQPAVELQNSEGAAKLSYSGQGWDASLSAFSGYSHLPEVQVTSISGNPILPTVAATQVYRNIWAVGGDASYSTEKWVYRFETAFTQTPNNDGSNITMEPSHWDSVLGAERALGSLFRVQAQVIARYFPRYISPSQASGPDTTTTAVNQVVAAENALLFQYQDPFRPSGTLRVSINDEKTGWDGEIFYLENFTGDDFLLRPRVTYAWSDFFKTTLGSEIYGGPSGRPLGALAPYSSIFVEGKYVF